MSASTIAWQPPPSVPPSGADCRVYERVGCELQTSCQPIAARSDRDVLWPATIRDVSEGGVGVVLGRRFERGAGLAIELPGNDERSAETLLAKVVHTTALPGGKWLLGCAFISRLSEDEVRFVVALAQSLQARPDEAPPAERESRASGPGKAEAPTLVLRDLSFEGTTHGGKVVTVPVRRLFLTGSWPLAAGTTLRMWVGDKDNYPAGIRVTVLACRQQAKGWMVSYRPVEAISAQTLRVLGFAG